MSSDVVIDTYGVRQALKELRDVGPAARAKAVNRVKRDTSAMLVPGKNAYPASVNLRGWSRGGRLGYDGGKVKSGVQTIVGGRTPRGANAFPIVTVVQRNAGGALFSVAGMRDGSQSNPGTDPKVTKAFIAKLRQEHGEAQRGLWSARGEIRRIASGSIIDALNELAAEVNRKVVT
jgi:hypothetical protein